MYKMSENHWTPKRRIRLTIISQTEYAKEEKVNLDLLSMTEVDEIYEESDWSDTFQDECSDFREGQKETDLPCDYSRHYESEAVGAKMYDGGWVGWTYWHGGGKHSDPDSIPWMEDAYEVDVSVEEKMVEVYTFKKKTRNNYDL